MNSQALIQGSDEWLASRMGKVTGSRAGAILGVNPFSKADDVLREMVREAHSAEREFTGNIATGWGNKYENTAISEYEATTGKVVISTGFHLHASIEWLGASPDGLVDNGLIEVKCPFSQKIKTLAEQKHYAAQIQLQLEVTNRSWCDFVTWTPDQLVIERVERDLNWLNDNLPVLHAFYQQYVSELDNAEHLESLEVYRDDDDWLAVESNYLAAKSQLDVAQKLVDQRKSEVLALVGDKKTRGPQLMAYPVVKSGSISYAKAVKDLLPGTDLEMYKGKPSKSWAVKAIR